MAGIGGPWRATTRTFCNCPQRIRRDSLNEQQGLCSIYREMRISRRAVCPRLLQPGGQLMCSLQHFAGCVGNAFKHAMF
jgi:hypothetical protein